MFHSNLEAALPTAFKVQMHLKVLFDVWYGEDYVIVIPWSCANLILQTRRVRRHELTYLCFSFSHNCFCALNYGNRKILHSSDYSPLFELCKVHVNDFKQDTRIFWGCHIACQLLELCSHSRVFIPIHVNINYLLYVCQKLSCPPDPGVS